jgi:putative membrane protein
MRKRLIFSLILLILSVIFAIQNSVDVTMKFFFWEAALPVALIIVISLAIGVIIGLLYSIPGKKSEEADVHKPKDLM